MPLAVPTGNAAGPAALPALLLQYFGQGALLMRTPAALANPFYFLAPDWMLYPLIAP